MQSIRTKVLAVLAGCVGLVAGLSQAATQEAVKNENRGILSRKSIVEHWLSFYVRLDAGQRYFIKDSDFSNRPKTKGVIGVGIGYRFSDHPVRIEFDVQNANFSVVAGPSNYLKAKTQNYVFNLYRDFNVPKNPKNFSSFRERISPYLTAGVGTARHSKIHGTALPQTGSAAAPFSHNNKKRATWNAGLGIKFYLDHVLSIDIGCKYIDLGNIPGNPNNAKARGYQGTVSVLVNAW